MPSRDIYNQIYLATSITGKKKIKKNKNPTKTPHKKQQYEPLSSNDTNEILSLLVIRHTSYIKDL